MEFPTYEIQVLFSAADQSIPVLTHSTPKLSKFRGTVRGSARDLQPDGPKF